VGPGLELSPATPEHFDPLLPIRARASERGNGRSSFGAGAVLGLVVRLEAPPSPAVDERDSTRRDRRLGSASRRESAPPGVAFEGFSTFSAPVGAAAAAAAAAVCVAEGGDDEDVAPLSLPPLRQRTVVPNLRNRSRSLASASLRRDANKAVRSRRASIVVVAAVVRGCFCGRRR
jgi:hypothetical protein